MFSELQKQEGGRGEACLFPECLRPVCSENELLPASAMHVCVLSEFAH